MEINSIENWTGKTNQPVTRRSRFNCFCSASQKRKNNNNPLDRVCIVPYMDMVVWKYVRRFMMK